MRYFFAYRFCAPEKHFGNIIIMVGWLGPPSGGSLLVAGLRIQISPPPDIRSSVAVSLITKGVPYEQVINWLVANAPRRPHPCLSVSNPLPAREACVTCPAVAACFNSGGNTAHQLKTLANPFQFTDEHSELWFCAKDVCEALDIHGLALPSKTCRKTGLWC
ncbi:MAG: hypothetical protein ACXWAT_15090 [Methylobacter sp.]